MIKIFHSIRFWKIFGRFFPTSILIIKNSGDVYYQNSKSYNEIDIKIDNIFNYVDPLILKQFKDNIAFSVASKKILSDIIKIKKHSNEILYYSYYLIPLENNYFSLFLINNTEINNENIMLNNIINTAPDPILVKDEQHRYLYVNQAFADVIGRTREEMLYKTDTDFFSIAESEVFYAFDRRTFKSGLTTTSEELLTGITGETRVIATKKSVFRTLMGNKILVGIIRDVTEVKQAKEALKKYASDLKRQVASRTKQLETKTNDLEQAVEKLKNLNSDLDCFAHICCHELREPLRAISSFSQVLLHENAVGNAGNLSHYLRLIHDSTIRMDKLMRSILDYSTNNLRTNTMGSFSSDALIAEVLTMLSTQIQEKHVVVTVDKMDKIPDLYADRLQVMQLFQNIINNSIKFSAKSCPPTIHITAKKKDKFIEFQIQDNGIGIPKIHHKNVFQPFKKFHSRAEGSTHGIGLSICKKIVENHNGLIKMSSIENVGTTFKFILPVQSIN